jgi:glycosyltransferase involved in cell wall biosynthesis
MVLTVSEEDKRILVDLDPALKSVEVVPIGVDVHYFQVIEREPAVPNVLSVATMYWPPNVDSMLYFHDEIWPLVKARVPNCVLTIAGQKPVPAIQVLASDGDVRVTGYVSDSRDLARYCSVFIVPLRSGSGVRVKLLNAMAMGLPIVSTSIGAEGLDVVGGQHLLIADTPGEFAGAVVDLINDRELGRRLGENARALVCEKYSWETVGARLLQVYEELTG